MNKQHGFTLIELVMVIVILGILAATAIPRFVDLSAEAETAALNGVLGAAQAAVAINYAAAQVGAASQITDCGDVAAELQGGLPTGYSIAGGASPCALTGPGGTANFDLL
jgi:MSHA pilin protein MshA